MANTVSQLLLLVINYWLVNGALGNVSSPYRPFGPQRCVELCNNSGAPSLSMREFHCRRHIGYNKEIQTNDDLFSCVGPTGKLSIGFWQPVTRNRWDFKKELEGKDQYVTSENAKKSDHAGTHGSTCKSKSACTFSGSKCHGGFCHCNVGFYFDLKSNACVKRCDSYGDQMVVYKNKGIKHKNRRKFKTTSLSDCIMKCQNETSFICLTAEYVYDFSGTCCNLSDKGFFDVPMKWRENRNPLCSLIQRTRCQ